jgi:hypothetical protein
VVIINKVCEAGILASVIGRYKSRYFLSDVFGLNYDGDAYMPAVPIRISTHFFMKVTKREKNTFTKG